MNLTVDETVNNQLSLHSIQAQKQKLRKWIGILMWVFRSNANHSQWNRGEDFLHNIQARALFLILNCWLTITSCFNKYQEYTWATCILFHLESKADLQVFQWPQKDILSTLWFPLKRVGSLFVSPALLIWSDTLFRRASPSNRRCFLLIWRIQHLANRSFLSPIQTDTAPYELILFPFKIRLMGSVARVTPKPYSEKTMIKWSLFGCQQPR